jgi:phospholipid/cholesterol/gamma-HCH transport system substrate-binding protein
MGRGPRIKTKLYPALLTRVHPRIAGLVGLVVISFIVYLVFAVTAVQGNPFAHKYTVHARFANVVGLSKNDFITEKGVRIGRVSAIDLAPGGRDANVDLSFDSIRLHDDATAIIRPRNLLGETWLEVNPGTPSRPELPDGAVLPVKKTVSPVQLDEVLATLTPPVRTALAQFIRETGTGLSGRGEDLSMLVRQSEPTLGSTGATLDALNAPQLGDLVATLNSDAATLASRSGELTSLVRNGNSLLGALAGDTRNIQSVIVDADVALGRADAVLHDRTQGLGNTVGELDKATRSVTTLVDQAKPVVDAVTPEVPTLIQFVRELQSATATSDLNGYFLRMIVSLGADSLSDPGYRGIPGSPGPPGPGSVVGRQLLPGPPTQGGAPLSPAISGMMDLLYGGS